MLTLDEIKDKMKDRRVGVVATATGVHRTVIHSLMRGGSNPSYATVKALSDYLMADR